MSNFGSNTPYGFSKGHQEPTQINKFNYKGGTWNKAIPYNDADGLDIDTGTTAHPGSTRKPNGTNYSGWLYFIPERLPEGITGKKFELDFVYFAGTGYYDFTGASDKNPMKASSFIDVCFYSESTRSWTNWTRLWGPVWTHHAGNEDTESATYYSDYAYYGLLNKNLQSQYVDFPSGKSFPTAKDTGETLTSYTAFKSYLQDKGVPIPLWDNGMHSYLQSACLGYRYLSNASTSWNNGVWTKHHHEDGKSYKRVKPNARGVSGPWQAAGSSNNLKLYDGGSSGTIPIYITADFIKNACGGTLASISKFKLRFFYGDVYWDWPKDDLPQWQALDNPQVGLLDWSEPTRNQQDWPPRYDARAWYRNKTAAIQQPELMVRYNYPGGTENTWTIN